MRRVLHIIHSLGRGGAETQLTYLCDGLVRANWDVHVAYMGRAFCDEINLAALADSGVHIHILPIKNHFNPLIVPALIRLIQGLDPDLVQTWLPFMDMAGGLAARAMRRPWILSERNNPGPEAESKRMRLRARIARGASAVVANSGTALDYWKHLLPEDIPQKVVRNVLPLDRIDAIEPADRSELGIPDDKRLVICAGRYEPQKNIENLLPALELITRDEQTIAMLCGRGPLQDEVDEFVRTNQLEDRIILPGFRHDLWSWIKSADIALSVSHFEGMPNVAIETMALGCPIVLSDIGPHREITDIRSADFVPCDDPERIAKTILDLLDDPPRLEAYARRNKERTRAWSVDAATREYEAVYNAISSG